MNIVNGQWLIRGLNIKLDVAPCAPEERAIGAMRSAVGQIDIERSVELLSLDLVTIAFFGGPGWNPGEDTAFPRSVW